MVNGGLAKQEDFGGEDPITPPPPQKKITLHTLLAFNKNITFRKAKLKK